MEYTETVKKLLSKAKQSPLKDGELIIGEVCVCESGAGWYIGHWCVEHMGHGLLPQPYDRLSDYYPSKEAALQDLPSYQEAEEGL